jgi:hypothetical protein
MPARKFAARSRTEFFDHLSPQKANDDPNVPDRAADIRCRRRYCDDRESLRSGRALDADRVHARRHRDDPARVVVAKPRPRSRVAPVLAADRRLCSRGRPAAGRSCIAGHRARRAETFTPGEFVTRQFRNHAGARAYKLYVPRSDAGERMPLIVMLHGCTQSPDDFAAGTQMNALAEQHRFVVAYPEQAANANGSKCWNWLQLKWCGSFSPNRRRALPDDACDGGVGP